MKPGGFRLFGLASAAMAMAVAIPALAANPGPPGTTPSSGPQTAPPPLWTIWPQGGAPGTLPAPANAGFAFRSPVKVNAGAVELQNKPPAPVGIVDVRFLAAIGKAYVLDCTTSGAGAASFSYTLVDNASPGAFVVKALTSGHARVVIPASQVDKSPKVVSVAPAAGSALTITRCDLFPG